MILSNVFSLFLVLFRFYIFTFQLSLHNLELILPKENTEQYYNLLSEKNIFVLFFKMNNMYLCLFKYINWNLMYQHLHVHNWDMRNVKGIIFIKKCYYSLEFLEHFIDKNVQWGSKDKHQKDKKAKKEHAMTYIKKFSPMRKSSPIFTKTNFNSIAIK